MELYYEILGGITVVLFIYLYVALFKPEMFPRDCNGAGESAKFLDFGYWVKICLRV